MKEHAPYLDLATVPPEEKVQAMAHIYYDDTAAPAELHAVGWQVLSQAFHTRTLDQPDMLPAARKLFHKVVENPDVVTQQGELFFDSKIVLATWGMFRSLATGADFTLRDRIVAQCNLGRLIESAAGPVDYRFDKLHYEAGQKLSQALVMGCALRSPGSYCFAVPSEPKTHLTKGIDNATGKSAYHAYLLVKGSVIPTYIKQDVHRHMRDPDRHRGVYQVALTHMLQNLANKHMPPLQQLMQAATETTRDGQLWLAQRAARAYADYAIEGRQPESSHINLLNALGWHIIRLARQYQPDGLNAPSRTTS